LVDNVRHPKTTMKILLALVITLGTGLPMARAQSAIQPPAPAGDWSTTEKWVWSQLVAVDPSVTVVLDRHCPDVHPPPENGKDVRWRNQCRTISPRFLRDVLVRAPWRDAIPYPGVQIDGALIDGNLDLENTRLTREAWLFNSRIEGGILLRRARSDSVIGLVGMFVAGDVTADGLQSTSDVLMTDSSGFQSVSLRGAKIGGQIVLVGARVGGTLDGDGLQAGHLYMRSDDQHQSDFKDVVLRGAKIGGRIDLTGARVGGTLEGDGLQAGHLFMRSDGKHQADFKEVVLRAAKIGGQIDLTGARVGGTLDADALQVGNLLMRSDGKHQADFKDVVLRGAKIGGQIDLTGARVGGTLDGDALQAGHLYMRSDDQYQSDFKDVVLRGAKIGGQIALVGARVGGTLNGDALQVGSSLIMRSDDQHQAGFKDVVLRSAKIDGQIDLTGARVGGTLDGDALQVGSSLFMRSDSRFASTFSGRVTLTFARIGDNLDLRGAVLSDLDLSSASISGELRLGAWGGRQTEWTDQIGKPSTLTLRNARVGNLADEEKAWPEPGHLNLDGFSFAHVGSFTRQPGTQGRARDMKWWDQHWARLDTGDSVTTYAQLAAALVAAGDRSSANEIRFRGRQRERDTAWANRRWGRWLGLTVLWLVAGYGIGGYTFFVLGWVCLFTLIGAGLLWFTVPAVRDPRRGPLWCVGASLSRLLPVIEINKEFTDFFNDPDRSRLDAWQSFVFSGLGIVGWVLGAILIAAMSGLTHNG
jgi:hypothetical protein